jgi:predicted nucleic acid-binding protein
MITPLLDANTLVRFVTGEPERHAREVANLIGAAEAGKIKLCVLPIVLAEAVFVLTGFYEHPRTKVAAALSHLISCPGFQAPEHARMIQALKLFDAGRLDFVDCYLAASSLVDGLTVISFDRDFDKLHGVIRKEPGDAVPPDGAGLENRSRDRCCLPDRRRESSARGNFPGD